MVSVPSLRMAPPLFVASFPTTVAVDRMSVPELRIAPPSVAFPPLSVMLTLEDELDISRGDLICPADNRPTVGQEIAATLCWLSPSPLRPSARYTLLHTTRQVRAMVTALHHRLEINTLEPDPTAGALALNEIGRVNLRTTTPLCYDPYIRNRTTGSFILVEEGSNATVAAGLIDGPATAGDEGWEI